MLSRGNINGWGNYRAPTCFQIRISGAHALSSVVALHLVIHSLIQALIVNHRKREKKNKVKVSKNVGGKKAVKIEKDRNKR